MSKVKMVALKQFLDQGRMVKIGEEFSTDQESARQLENAETAKRVGGDKIDPTRTGANDTEFSEETNFSGMKVAELRAYAEQKGINDTSAMTKPELVAALNALS